MILRNFVRLCVFGGCFVFLGIVHASGLTNLSDTQIQTMIQQDQTQYYELMEKAQREQQLGNQASVERVRTEVETINQRLQAYSEELRRRGVVPGGASRRRLLLSAESKNLETLMEVSQGNSRPMVMCERLELKPVIHRVLKM